MDAFGRDKIIIETVGAGQNEIDIVRTADTVAVLVPPGSGDDIQTLKAGILEIADIFVVNKADRDGADRTVQELREMIHLGDGERPAGGGGHHSQEIIDAHDDWDGEPDEDDETDEGWTPPIVETVAIHGTGVDEFIDELAAHRDYLVDSGEHADQVRTRYAEEIRTLLREGCPLDARGGTRALPAGSTASPRPSETARPIRTRSLSDVLEPVEDCLEDLDTDTHVNSR